jgi:predicted membrane-bound spermidine synthase
MKTAIILAGFFGIVAAAVIWATWVWTAVGDANMSVHGYIALGLMIVFCLIVGCGHMALVFYSNRKGYDEPPKSEN